MNLVYNEITGEFEEVRKPKSNHPSVPGNAIEEFRNLYIYKHFGTKAKLLIESYLNDGLSIPKAFDKLKQAKARSYYNAIDRLHYNNPGIDVFASRDPQRVTMRRTRTSMELWIDAAKEKLEDLGFRYSEYRRFELPNSYIANHGKKWTLTDEERLKAMFAAGFTVQSMAISLKRKYSPIISRLNMIYGDNWSTSDTEVNKYGYRIMI